MATHRKVKGIAFDLYGTLVDVGAIADACKEVAPGPGAFTAQWRTKQVEYTFLWTPSSSTSHRQRCINWRQAG